MYAYDVATGPADVSTGNLASFRLRLRYEENYPHQPLDIRILDPQGIPHDTVVTWKRDLDALARTLAA